MGTFRIKRIYDAPASTDGKRVLVDRLWPRAVSKKSAKLDLWLKEIAPSTGLRKWFSHDPERFDEFRDRYCEELEENFETVGELYGPVGQDNVTLIYAARDGQVNHAIVLVEFLEEEVIIFERIKGNRRQ